MYAHYAQSVPSLHRQSTDCLIYIFLPGFKAKQKEDRTPLRRPFSQMKVRSA